MRLGQKARNYAYLPITETYSTRSYVGYDPVSSVKSDSDRTDRSDYFRTRPSSRKSRIALVAFDHVPTHDEIITVYGFHYDHPARCDYTRSLIERVSSADLAYLWTLMLELGLIEIENREKMCFV